MNLDWWLSATAEDRLMAQAEDASVIEPVLDLARRAEEAEKRVAELEAAFNTVREKLAAHFHSKDCVCFVCETDDFVKAALATKEAGRE